MAAAAAESTATTADGKMRALFTLKHVLRTLRTKRFVVEWPQMATPDTVGMWDIHAAWGRGVTEAMTAKCNTHRSQGTSSERG